MSITRRLAVPFLAASALLVPLSVAASNGNRVVQDQDQEQVRVITRVYSLRPLVAEARESASYEPGLVLLGDMLVNPGGSSVGSGGEPSATADEVIKHVISIITQTIDPETWQENGGPTGTVTYLPINSRLIITHTNEVHARVAQLIGELQDRQVVSIRGRLVRMPEAQVEQNTRVVDGVAIWQADPADLPVLAQVRFSGFDGTAQHVASGRSVGYFQSVQPIVAANAVAYQPSTSDLQTGLVLRATPILNVDGNSATVQINAQYILLDENQPIAGYWQLAPDSGPGLGHLQLKAKPQIDPTTQLLRIEAHLAPSTQPGAAVEAVEKEGFWVSMPAAAGISAPVLPDRLSVHRRSLETSLRVPVGQWVLVGTVGASADGEPTQEEPLHLLIRIDAGGGQ